MGIGENIINKWKDSKKSFRYMNRITLHHDKYPLKIDLSIIKESKSLCPTHDYIFRFEEKKKIHTLKLNFVPIDKIYLPYKNIGHPASKGFLRVVMVYITPTLVIETT